MTFSEIIAVDGAPLRRPSDNNAIQQIPIHRDTSDFSMHGGTYVPRYTEGLGETNPNRRACCVPGLQVFGSAGSGRMRVT